jgi:uncharacterized protein YjiS (DUF1127 family)
MSTRNLAHAAPQALARQPLAPQALAPQALSVVLNPPRSPAARISEFLRAGFATFAAWCRRRRERDALYEYLASDHRAASDIGYPHRLS